MLVSQEYVALPGFFTGMLGTQTQAFICTALLLFSRFSCVYSCLSFDFASISEICLLFLIISHPLQFRVLLAFTFNGLFYTTVLLFVDNILDMLLEMVLADPLAFPPQC